MTNNSPIPSVRQRPTALSRPPTNTEIGPPAAQARQGRFLRRAVRFGLEVIGAKRVSVVGTFNNWDAKATPLRCVGGTRWFVYWPVEIGRHEYRFLVDGQPVDDPKAREFAPSSRGGRNAVLRVTYSRHETPLGPTAGKAT